MKQAITADKLVQRVHIIVYAVQRGERWEEKTWRNTDASHAQEFLATLRDLEATADLVPPVRVVRVNVF